MEFRDLKKQYQMNKANIDAGIQKVIDNACFIQGEQVKELEETLAKYIGVKHCISCANGTDALQLALMAWNIGRGDAVFVPDFTFFSSGEVVSAVGAVPVFVDVDENTYNISIHSLECMIKKTIDEGELTPKVIIAVDLFGQPAWYSEIKKIAEKYHLYILEDAAQGFGGAIEEVKTCAFGDISITSFFPAKPLGCYGDGGAIFTNNDEWSELLRSMRVHGKNTSKYDNVRIGMNSRLDTIQAAILLAKFPVFQKMELKSSQKIAELYTKKLKDLVKTPVVKEGYLSSWAQYTIQMSDRESRDRLQSYLKKHGIPSAIYYQKPMHRQKAFAPNIYDESDYVITNRLCDIVISLPFHPYMDEAQVEEITWRIREYLRLGC